MKRLVVYFSHRGENYGVGYLTEGNAEHIAKVIQKETGADLFELVPKHPYSENYMECVKEAVEEMKKDSRPEIVGDIDVSRYDVVYLCYPNWCGTFPRIVATFLEKHDFTGKVVYPMCTNEGSGMGRSWQDLQKALPHSVLKEGLSIRGSEARTSDDKIRKWIEL